MFYGFVGLALTYVLLVTLLLWIFTKANVSEWKKFMLIPLTLWYSFALYYTPLGFMGYPVSKDLPDKAIVISVKIVEPSNDHKGGMYFWMIDVNKIKSLPADPRKAFIILDQQEPRAYKIPYDRDLHKDLVKKKKKSQEEGGVLRWSKQKQRGSGTEKERHIKGKFQVTNPLSLLPSKNNPE